MVLEKDNAIADWHALMCPINASKAKISHPHRLYMFTNQTICVCLINFSMAYLFINLNNIRAKCGFDTGKKLYSWFKLYQICTKRVTGKSEKELKREFFFYGLGNLL